MKIKTSELTGAALDWAVCIAKGIKPEEIYISRSYSKPEFASLYLLNRDEDGKLDGTYTTGSQLLFSRKWEAGGPIIDILITKGLRLSGYKTRFSSDPCTSQAQIDNVVTGGSTVLVAAMRCYVVLSVGNEIDIPQELLK